MMMEELYKKAESQRHEFKVFDDHIRFVNPGTLMGELTPEVLLRGEYVAMHRNKLLAEAFYLRGDIEKFGTGFFRMQNELQEYPELKLSFETVYGFTRTGLDVVMGDTEVVSVEDTPHDTPHDTMQDTMQVNLLINIIEGDMTRSELQSKLSLQNRDYFRRFYLLPALELHLIEMAWPDKPNSKNQKYRLTEKGKQLKININK